MRLITREMINISSIVITLGSELVRMLKHLEKNHSFVYFSVFVGPDFFHVMDKILKGIFKPIPPVFCPSIAELVRVMLRPDPARRPTVAQVQNLAHPFYLTYLLF